MHPSKNHKCTTHTNTNKYHLRISNWMDAGCKCIFIIRFLRKLLRSERGRCCHQRQRRRTSTSPVPTERSADRARREKMQMMEYAIMHIDQQETGLVCGATAIFCFYVYVPTYENRALPCASCNGKMLEHHSMCVRVWCDVMWCGVFQFGETSNKQIIGKRYASLFAPFVISRRMSCKHHSGTSTIIQMYTDTVSGVLPMPSISDSNFTHIVIVHGRYKQELM